MNHAIILYAINRIRQYFNPRLMRTMVALMSLFYLESYNIIVSVSSPRKFEIVPLLLHKSICIKISLAQVDIYKPNYWLQQHFLVNWCQCWLVFLLSARF